MFKPIQVRDWCEWAHGEIDREQQLARPYRCAGFLCTELLEALSPFDEKLRIVFRKMFQNAPPFKHKILVQSTPSEASSTKFYNG